MAKAYYKTAIWKTGKGVGMPKYWSYGRVFWVLKPNWLPQHN